MNFKRKLYTLIVLLLLIFSVQLLFPGNPQLVGIYDRFFYYPFQSLRGLLFGFIQVSIGDIAYFAGGLFLLVTVIRWVKYLCRFSTDKWCLAASLFNTVNFALFIYLFFFLGWGANYYKLPLRDSWALRAHNDTLSLVTFDSVLVNRLNSLAPTYRPTTLAQINKQAAADYRQFTDSKVALFGLAIKPTLYGYFMERVAVDGYYNPFTGEGQVVKRLPACMLPFVVTHEMAHQAGIAAEGDANLVAYALGIMSPDKSFNYSANLNLWLYVNARLFRKDSVIARSFESRLNALTTAHLDTLEQLSKLYDNQVSKITGDVYDDYLKMQKQKEGIHSYGNVTANAWLFELKQKREKIAPLHIP